MAVNINRKAPKSGIASLMANKGRYGDSELVHMSPMEVKSLQMMGKMSVNPQTGLPEAFGLKNILPIIGNVALGVATGGLSVPAQMAIMGAANVAMAKAGGASNKEALTMGAFSALTAGAGAALSGAGSQAAAEAGKAANQAAIQGAQQAGGKALSAEAMKGGVRQGIDAGLGGVTVGAGKTAATANALKYGATGAPVSQASISQAANAARSSVPQGMAAMGNAPKEMVTAGSDGWMGKGIDFVKGDGTAASLDAQKFDLFPTGGAGVSKLKAAEIAAKETALGGITQLAKSEQEKAEEANKKLQDEYDSAMAGRAANREAIQSEFDALGPRQSQIQNYMPPDQLTAEEVQAAYQGKADPLDFFIPASKPAQFGGAGGSNAMTSALGDLQHGAVGYQNTVNLGGPTQRRKEGGQIRGGLTAHFLNTGGSVEMFRGLVEDDGTGDGMSDNVEFDVEGSEEIDKAMLSPDEYVIDASTVSAIGNGSTDAGAKRLDNFVENVREKAYEKGKQPKENAGLKALAKLQSQYG